MLKIPNFEIIVFIDPSCTWCWGSEPILRKLETKYLDKIKISYITGGLIEDIRNYRDLTNNIGGDIIESNKNIANYWLDASKTHKMPIDVDGLKIFSNEYPSSYPASIAFHAAKIQSEELATKLLRRIYEAAMTEQKQIGNIEILKELASEVGIKMGSFIQSLNDGSAESMFQNDLLYAKTNRIFNFPAFLIRNNYNGKSVILRGFQKYKTLNDVLKYLCDEEFVDRKLEAIPQNIIEFLMKYKKVASIELKETFDLNDNQFKKLIKELESKGHVVVEKVGTDKFIYYSGKKLYCDEQSGICYY